MKNLTRRQRFWLGALLIWAGLWGASQWWEKALGKPAGAPDISPNGCYRVQTFKPFWLLPGFFHPYPHPDDQMPTRWFAHWQYPAFFRLYDQRNGQLIGESGVYDLVGYGGPFRWGSMDWPSVSSGMIEIGPNQPDCIGDQPDRQ